MNHEERDVVDEYPMEETEETTADKIINKTPWWGISIGMPAQQNAGAGGNDSIHPSLPNRSPAGSARQSHKAVRIMTAGFASRSL